MKSHKSAPKNAGRISWKESGDPESEDRLEFLKLSPEKRWQYLMTLILATYPSGKKPTFDKKIIEWK